MWSYYLDFFKQVQQVRISFWICYTKYNLQNHVARWDGRGPAYLQTKTEWEWDPFIDILLGTSLYSAVIALTKKYSSKPKKVLAISTWRSRHGRSNHNLIHNLSSNIMVIPPASCINQPPTTLAIVFVFNLIHSLALAIEWCSVLYLYHPCQHRLPTQFDCINAATLTLSNINCILLHSNTYTWYLYNAMIWCPRGVEVL